jgi:hypothetical protein
MAASCEKGHEISTGTFQIQQVVKKDMALEVIFLHTMIYRIFSLKEDPIKQEINSTL